MQRTQRVQRPLSVLFAGLVMLASSIIVAADSSALTAPLVWSPVYSPAHDEVWYPPAAVSKKDGGPGGPTACAMDTAGTDGHPVVNPVWTYVYASRADQTAFRVCGEFNGQGEVLLTYGGAGKPTAFDYTSPTALCLDTYSSSDGNGMPRVLDLYLVQLGTHTPSIGSPSILVGEQP